MSEFTMFEPPPSDQLCDMREKEYRRYAQEARQQAEKAISPDDKRRWLEIAEEWLKLAISVEAWTAARKNL
jgi:hypothetical protein